MTQACAKASWRSDRRMWLQVAARQVRIARLRTLSKFMPRSVVQASRSFAIGRPTSAVRCNSKPPADDGVQCVEFLPRLECARACRSPASNMSALRRTAMSGPEMLTSRRPECQACRLRTIRIPQGWKRDLVHLGGLGPLFPAFQQAVS
jgi:hypothetical protein